MKWLHTVATSTPAPEPTLTPLENDVWTADSILQMMRSKQDTNEGSNPREKRFVFLGWLAFDQLQKELKESVPKKTTVSLQKREVEDPERAKRFLSAWMILDFIRGAFVKKPESLPEPVALDDHRIPENSTNVREKRSIGTWVNNMMDWLNLPLMGNQTLLTKSTTSTPTIRSTTPTVDYLYEEDEPSSEAKPDYSYDAYVLVLVFGISLLAVGSTLAMYMYGEYKESLLRQESEQYALEVMEIALSVWTIETGLEGTCDREPPPPYDVTVRANIERF
jgi:hypothetical protein